MRDKYRYVDPDLEALYDAEAAARGEVRPPPRKKRHITNRNKQQSIPVSPDPSAPGDFSIEVDQPSTPPQQPQPQPSGHHQLARRSDLHHDADLPPQPLFQVPRSRVEDQLRLYPPERFTFEMGAAATPNKEFFITLCYGLKAKGHSVREVSNRP